MNKTNAKPFFRWLVIALVLGVWLAVVAAWLPPEVKKLGIFSVGIGILYVLIVSFLSSSPARKICRTRIILLVLLAGAVEAGRTAEAYRLYREYHDKVTEKQLDELPAFAQGMRDDFAANLELDYTSYLHHKYSVLPVRQTPPVSYGLYSLEIILAMLGAAGMIYFLRRSNSSEQMESSPEQPPPDREVSG